MFRYIFIFSLLLSGCDWKNQNDTSYIMCKNLYVKNHLIKKHGGEPDVSFANIRLWKSKNSAKYMKVYFESKEIGKVGEKVKINIECNLASSDEEMKVYSIYRNKKLVEGLVYSTNKKTPSNATYFVPGGEHLEEVRKDTALIINKNIELTYELENEK